MSGPLRGIIANEKGKGYGKQIMMAIRESLIACDKTSETEKGVPLFKGGQ
jgi:hypothetical protein